MKEAINDHHILPLIYNIYTIKTDMSSIYPFLLNFFYVKKIDFII